MIIGRDLKYVFMSTPKAATNSMYAWLTEHYGGVHDKRQVFHGTQVPEDCLDFFKWTIVRNPYSRAVSIWWVLTQDPDRDERWVDMVGDEPLGFEAFWEWVLTHHHSRDGAVCWSQVEFHGEYNVPPDRIISIERLWWELASLPFVDNSWLPKNEFKTVEEIEKDLKEPQCAMRWGMPRLPHLNETRSKRKPWRDYYTPHALALVNQWGRVDADAFGYRQVETVPEFFEYDNTRHRGQT